MKERPILFSAPMVRAILDGRKTMTRRVVKTRSYICDVVDGIPYEMTEDDRQPIKCPYGIPGDKLWVRETWAYRFDYSRIYYRADENLASIVNRLNDRWMPSIFMPRSASRITLEITGVRLERLHEITEEDSLREGITPHPSIYFPGQYKSKFKSLWKSINGPGSWDKNPLVWVITFKLIEP